MKIWTRISEKEQIKIKEEKAILAEVGADVNKLKQFETQWTEEYV